MMKKKMKKKTEKPFTWIGGHVEVVGVVGLSIDFPL